MNIVRDTILNSDQDIIVQQVNCMGVMGSGLAKTIADKYPNVLYEYTKLCNSMSSEELLGSVQLVSVGDKMIANIFGQDGYGNDKRYTVYPALKDGLTHVRDIAISTNKTISIPYGIGSGLGGGSWNYILKMIKQVYEGSEVGVILYKI